MNWWEWEENNFSAIFEIGNMIDNNKKKKQQKKSHKPHKKQQQSSTHFHM